MNFYFRLIPNFNSGRVKNPNDPTCEKLIQNLYIYIYIYIYMYVCMYV